MAPSGTLTLEVYSILNLSQSVRLGKYAVLKTDIAFVKVVVKITAFYVAHRIAHLVCDYSVHFMDCKGIVVGVKIRSVITEAGSFESKRRAC